MNYVKTQLELFKRGIKIRRSVILSVIEFAKFLVLGMLAILSIVIFMKLFHIAKPGLDILASIKLSGITDALASSFSVYSPTLSSVFAWLIVIALTTLLSTCVIIALADGIIMSIIRKSKLSFRYILRIAVFSLILDVITTTILIILLLNINDGIALAVYGGMLALLYFYILLAITVTSDDIVSFWKNAKQLFHSIIRIDYTVIPILASIIALYLAILILALISIILKEYIVILFVPAMLLWIVWIKNYAYHVYNNKIHSDHNH